MNRPRQSWILVSVLLAAGCQGVESQTASRGASPSTLPPIEEPSAAATVLSASPTGASIAEGLGTQSRTRSSFWGAALPDDSSRPAEGRMLLRTGAIQLGPGVGKNLWGWQGDGLSGF